MVATGGMFRLPRQLVHQQDSPRHVLVCPASLGAHVGRAPVQEEAAPPSTAELPEPKKK